MVNVEILCKSPCKTLCISGAKFCSKLPHTHQISAKLHFPTYFSRSSHQLSHSLLTPVVQLFYPLFHNPYYYNYYKYLSKGKEN